MNMINLFMITALLCLSMIDTFAQTPNVKVIPPIKIIYPKENTLKYESTINVVIESLQSADTLIIISPVEEKNIKLQSKKTTYCQNISLRLGQNSVILRSYKDDVMVDEQVRDVFVTSKPYNDQKSLPEKYIQNFFHTKTHEVKCIRCHDMSVNEQEGIAFMDVSESNCYKCHNRITKEKYAHAPSVNWLCRSCHTGKTGQFNKKYAYKSQYLVADPVSQECFKCHDKQKEEWGKKRFRHKPVDSGRCDKCHNSHSSEEVFYLRKPVWELCTECHEDKISGMHVVKTFTNVVHPTHGKKDPSRPGKDLSCISCHDPHASNGPSLLRSSSAIGLCSKCHQK